MLQASIELFARPTLIISAGDGASRTIAPDRFVLDGSVTLAWLFQDEKDAYADAVIGKLPHIEMLVPRLWHLEAAAKSVGVALYQP